jgi:DNA-binding IclR family transcriptional regulator
VFSLCSTYGGMQHRTLVPYLLRALAVAQRRGRTLTLEDLSRALAVRKTDVRALVSALHHEGFVDALRLRLTLAGFAIGAALAKQKLPPLRRPAPLALVPARAA